jgi:hypothetical protein
MLCVVTQPMYSRLKTMESTPDVTTRGGWWAGVKQWSQATVAAMAAIMEEGGEGGGAGGGSMWGQRQQATSGSRGHPPSKSSRNFPTRSRLLSWRGVWVLYVSCSRLSARKLYSIVCALDCTVLFWIGATSIASDVFASSWPARMRRCRFSHRVSTIGVLWLPPAVLMYLSVHGCSTGGCIFILWKAANSS